MPININASKEPTSIQSEITLDVNPANPLQIAGFSHNFDNLSEIDVFHSSDGGMTWNTTTIDDGTSGIDDGFGPADRRFDPSIAFDADGNLFIAYGHKANLSDTIVVAKSTDGGGSFFQSRSIDSESISLDFLDKWHLATGPAGPSSNNQAVYIAFTEGIFALPVSSWHVMVAGSNDGGDTFTTPVRVSDDPIDAFMHQRLFADPAVGPNGELYVSWSDRNFDNFDQASQALTEETTIFFDSDLDGLFASNDSFGTNPLAVGIDVAVRTMEKTFSLERVPAQPGRGIHNGPVLDVDQSIGRLYLTWVDAIDANFDTTKNSDIFLAYSVNDGASWTLPSNVGNVENSMGTDFLPWIDVDQTTGSVNLIYYTTDGNPDSEVDVRLATSVDGGDSFQHATLSRATSDETGGEINDYLEYIGLAVHDGTAHGLWSSRISTTSTDLEALSASAAFESITGTNLLTVTGDDAGVTDDDIEVRLSPVNNNFLEVLINGTQEFAGLLATIDAIIVDGLLGANTYLMDPSLGIPVTLPPPRIKSVIVSNAGTLDSYDFSTALYQGAPVAGSGNQLRTVPVGGADTVSIVFDQAVNADAADLGLIGVSAINAIPNVPTLATNGYSYDSANFTATWTYEFSSISTSDFYLLKLTDGVNDGSSTGVTGTATGAKLLDGEWTNPANINVLNTAGVSVFPSGDGAAGGDFQFVFTILPDLDQNNLVNSGDLAILLSFFNSVNTTFAQGDFNGSTDTNSADLALLLTAFNANLQALLIEVDRAGDPFSFDQDDIDWYIQNNQEDDPLYLAFAAFQGLYGDIGIDVAS